MNDKCPFCRSTCVKNDENDIAWDCGTVLMKDKNVFSFLEPTDECKKRVEERIKIRITDVSQYVLGMKEIEDLIPVTKTDTVRMISDERKHIHDLLDRISTTE